MVSRAIGDYLEGQRFRASDVTPSDCCPQDTAVILGRWTDEGLLSHTGAGYGVTRMGKIIFVSYTGRR
jgi:hypothetical protein